MYHIRRADNHDERSIHMENEVGLRYAVTEALMRAKHTGIDHQVVDDNGEILHVISDVHSELPHEVLPVVKQWKIPVRVFWASAVLAAAFLLRYVGS